MLPVLLKLARSKQTNKLTRLFPWPFDLCLWETALQFDSPNKFFLEPAEWSSSLVSLFPFNMKGFFPGHISLGFEMLLVLEFPYIMGLHFGFFPLWLFHLIYLLLGGNWGHNQGYEHLYQESISRKIYSPYINRKKPRHYGKNLSTLPCQGLGLNETWFLVVYRTLAGLIPRRHLSAGQLWGEFQGIICRVIAGLVPWAIRAAEFPTLPLILIPQIDRHHSWVSFPLR